MYNIQYSSIIGVSAFFYKMYNSVILMYKIRIFDIIVCNFNNINYVCSLAQNTNNTN